MNSFFPDKLYCIHGDFSAGLSAKSGIRKIIPFELTLMEANLSDEKVDNIKALYRLRNVNENSCYNHKELFSNTTDVLVGYSIRSRKQFIAFNLYKNELNFRNQTDWIFAHYIVTGIDIKNADFDKILLKKKNTRELNKKIEKESALIKAFNGKYIALRKAFILKLVEKEFEKYGKKLGKGYNFYISNG